MNNQYEFWYDPKHTGAIRAIDKINNIIYGSDPAEKKWIAYTSKEANNEMIVDFTPKKTHVHNKIFIAKYTNRRQNLEWYASRPTVYDNDGVKDKEELDNTWLRIRVPINHVLSQIQ